MGSVPEPLPDYRVAWEWDELTRWQSPLLLVFEAHMVDDSDWLRHLRLLRNRLRAYLVLTAEVPCQGIAEKLARLNVRDPARVHVAEVQTFEEEKVLIERLFLALGSGEEHKRILGAWWEGDTFVVVNPRFKRLHVPVGRIGSLSGQPREKLQDLQIDEDGVFVYWPELDVHLGWEQFAQAANQEEYLRARQQSAEFNAQYGQAIRRLRRKQKLRQSDMKGLTSRQVGRIERGECRATHSALSKLARSHGMSTSEYLAELADLS